MDDALRLPTCSIGRAMEILGERWTLLILRECFYGVKRFSVMQRNLGIARNILSSRLQMLVRTGILERRRYQDEPERFEYKLTREGTGAVSRRRRDHALGRRAAVRRAAVRSCCATPAAISPTPCWSAPTAATSSTRARSRRSRRTARRWPNARFLLRNRHRRRLTMSVQDPTEQLWGGETTKAVANFPVSGERVPVAVVRWLGRIKGAAARVNADLGLLDAALAERIAAAADEIARGEHDDQFPIDVFQTGSGTSSNMNANEVIATLAGDGAHPNDHVNMGQSSNDVFPSAVHLAALDEATNRLLPALERLERSFAAKAEEFADIVKSGPHPPDGRRAGDARPGVRRLRRAGPARPPARRGRAAAGRADPARRHRDRHRPQHAPGVRRAGARAAGRRAPGSRSARPRTRSRRRATATRWSSCRAR